MKIQMKAENQNKTHIKFNAVLVLLAFAITVLAILYGANFRVGFDLQIGQVARQKFYAPRMTENIVVTERNRAAAYEAAMMQEPNMHRETSIEDSVNENISSFTEDVTEARLAYQEYQRDWMARAAALRADADESSYENDIDIEGSSDQELFFHIMPAMPDRPNIPIYLSDPLMGTLFGMSNAEFTMFMIQVDEVVSNVFDIGVQDMDAKTHLDIREELDLQEMSAEARALAYEIIAFYLRPNILINEEATERARAERAAQYEVVYFLQDQTIVDEGQIITEEAYAVLVALGIVRTDHGQSILFIVGIVIMVGSLFALLMAYINVFHGDMLNNRREGLLLFTLYVATVSISWLSLDAPRYFLPILPVTLLMAMLFEVRLAIIFNAAVTIVAMLVWRGDPQFIVFFILTGIFVSLVSKWTAERNKIIAAGLTISLFCAIVEIGLIIFFENTFGMNMLDRALFAAIAGLFSVVISVGTAPFWEGVFGAVTAFRLLDLANPNSPLLRRLTMEAPGTYHHCLIVANLSESAAFAIGANPNLARAGGYYHDIGKLKYPQYFSENQASNGDNLHEDMDPASSAAVVISHVGYGLELADKYRIPMVIKEMISQHHGNSLMKFFYMKAMELEPDTPLNEADFRYPFVPPQSKESAIVMMADTVEAAVRSMIPKGKAMEEVERFVRKLISDKLEDGQLIDSKLTLKDIDTIIESFMRVFRGMYHERIPYPDIKKAIEKGEAEA